MGVERHDVRKNSAESERLRRIAKRIDERVVPTSALANVVESALQIGIGFLKTGEHARRRAVGRGGSVDVRHGASSQGGAPNFLRENDVFQQLPQSLCRFPPRQNLYDRL